MSMNRKTWIIIILVILVTALITWYVAKSQNAVTPPTETATSTSATTTTVTVEVKTLTYNELQNKAILEYVQFPNQPARSALAELNLEIESVANETFKKNTKELDSNLKDLQKYGMNLEGREFVHEREIDKARIYTNQNTGVISIIFQNYVDFGGAHGSFFYGSTVYDIKTGAELKLTDFLQGDYVTFLNAYITEEIKQKTTTCKNCEQLDGNVDVVDGKVVSDSFALNADGIIFLYGAYDLGSYAATASGQEVFVSKEKLAEFIKRQW